MKYKPLTVDLKYENLVEFSHFEKQRPQEQCIIRSFLRFSAGLSASTALYSFVPLRPWSLVYRFVLHDASTSMPDRLLLC